MAATRNMTWKRNEKSRVAPRCAPRAGILPAWLDIRHPERVDVPEPLPAIPARIKATCELPPLPEYGPTPWRQYVAVWGDQQRQQWASKAEEYQDAGEHWQEAELKAFLDLCDPDMEGPSPITRGAAS